MKLKTFLRICILCFFLIGIIFNIITIITYPLDVDNCQKILKHNNLATNDDSIRCIKIINQPIYSYYIPEILAGWVVSLFFCFIVGLITGIIYDGIKGFEKPKIEDDWYY